MAQAGGGKTSVLGLFLTVVLAVPFVFAGDISQDAAARYILSDGQGLQDRLCQTSHRTGQKGRRQAE